MILGIDYGLKNIGLAISEGKIAQPYGTIKIKNQKQKTQEIKDVVNKLAVKLIVVGISEGKSKERSLAFGRKIASMLELPIEYIDETLSTLEAESGRRSDKDKAHARAAAIILQRYLDGNQN